MYPQGRRAQYITQVEAAQQMSEGRPRIEIRASRNECSLLEQRVESIDAEVQRVAACLVHAFLPAGVCFKSQYIPECPNGGRGRDADL